MTSTSTYLITGASRGIGLGLLKHYLTRPNSTVIAGLRDPATQAAAIQALPVASGTKLITVKIDSKSSTDAQTAVETLKTKYGIEKLDVVLANAGLGNSWKRVMDTPAETVREYTEVNVIGPLLLFQAVQPLLSAAPEAKFILLGTGVSSFGLMEHYALPSAGYGASKAAISYIARKIHFEHPNITSVIVHPGWVKTELGNSIADAVGMKEATLDLEDSVKGVTQVVDNATREKTSGHFLDYSGKELLW